MAIQHTFKTVGGKLKTRLLTRKSAIRENCIQCMQAVREVAFCTSKTCPLWPFRMGQEQGAKDDGEMQDGQSAE